MSFICTMLQLDSRYRALSSPFTFMRYHVRFFKWRHYNWCSHGCFILLGVLIFIWCVNISNLSFIYGYTFISSFLLSMNAFSFQLYTHMKWILMGYALTCTFGRCPFHIFQHWDFLWICFSFELYLVAVPIGLNKNASTMTVYIYGLSCRWYVYVLYSDYMNTRENTE